MDDSSIVSLVAEKVKGPARCEIEAREWTPDLLRLPEGDPVEIERWIKPIYNTIYLITGNPLDWDLYEKDVEFRRYLRKEFEAQSPDLIEDKCELFGIIGSDELRTRTPLKDRLAAKNLEIMPTKAPDVDNLAYTILYALVHAQCSDPRDVQKISIIKTYHTTEPRNKIWIKNWRAS